VKVFCQIKTTKKEGSIITSFSYFFIGQQWMKFLKVEKNG
jgi:hypothetical protein